MPSTGYAHAGDTNSRAIQEAYFSICDFHRLHLDTSNSAMQVRIRKGKQGKYALTHINYDITHGHLEVWTQSANTADTNSDSRDDKARKAKEDT